jgi:purine-binding chemotaxis protein CheW
MSEATMVIEARPLLNCRTLLAFRLGTQTYAFAVESVVQIISMVTITPLPQLDRTVEGVINVQGTAVPVVDMRRHLGLAEARYEPYTPILLIRSGECIVGLIVDEILDVLSLPLEAFIPPLKVLPHDLGQAPVVRELVKITGELALFLDPAHLFSPHQREALGRAATWLPDLRALEAEGTQIRAACEAAPGVGA